MTKPFAAPSVVRTVGLVLLSTVALFAADMFLAKMERKETHIAAAHLYKQGQGLMKRGDIDQAIERFEDAIAIERTDRGYQRSLAEAQLAAGKSADAEATATQLLQTDSTDAATNLVMGRILAREDRFEEATAYYRRAIYGQWKKDAAANRLRVRFELIGLLAQHNSKEELLAELLPAQAEAPSDPATQTRLGQLFLAAGSPNRAAEVFHEVLHEAPANTDAHAGLGEAEFAAGNYRAAQRDFQSVLRVSPDNQSVRQRLELCDDLLAMDPTVRGLDSADRFRRSTHLLALIVDQTKSCAGPSVPPDLQGLLDKSSAALQINVKPAHQAEVAESNLDLSEQLWQAGKKACKTPPPATTPLALVLARLAQ